MTSGRRPTRRALTSGGTLTRNIVINTVGQGIPILAAVAATPPLLLMLGAERFGVLSLSWIVMLHLGLLDLGLGRATTRAVAAQHEREESTGLPGLVCTSLVLHACLGLVGGAFFALLTPWLTATALKVPAALLPETRQCFYLLALSVPLSMASVALRAVLEALQRFDLANAIRTPAAVLNFVGPLGVLTVLDSLTAVVASLVLLRLATLVANALACLHVVPDLRSGMSVTRQDALPLLRFGSWLTVSSLVLPVLISLDRLVIPAAISLSDLAVYATPHEILTKLTILPAALLAVLFPAFSALSVRGGGGMRRLYEKAFGVLTLVVVPPIVILLALADDLMGVWLPGSIAQDSATISRWLAVGVLVNVLAHLPLTALHGLGRADVGAKVQVAQLLPYAALLWWAATQHGLVGVAAVWSLRALVELVVLLALAHHHLPGREDMKRLVVLPAGTWVGVAVILGVSAGLSVARLPLSLTVILVVTLVAAFLACPSLSPLRDEERAQVSHLLRRWHDSRPLGRPGPDGPQEEVRQGSAHSVQDSDAAGQDARSLIRP